PLPPRPVPPAARARPRRRPRRGGGPKSLWTGAACSLATNRSSKVDLPECYARLKPMSARHLSQQPAFAQEASDGCGRAHMQAFSDSAERDNTIEATLNPLDNVELENGAAMRDTIFDRLVSGESDVVGLLAYSLSMQNKRDWLAAFQAETGRAPSADE